MKEDYLNNDCKCCKGICDCEYGCDHPHNDYLIDEIIIAIDGCDCEQHRDVLKSFYSLV